MATTHLTHRRSGRKSEPRVNLLSVAVLMVALVGIALVLIGVARSGSSPLWVLPPMALAFWCIMTLRK